MGQKVHPIGFRVGITRDWESRWFASKQDYGRYLVEDFHIRRYIKENLHQAGVGKVEIERNGEEVEVFIHTARPGVVIGRRGAEVDRLKENISRVCNGRKVSIKIVEIQKPELCAQLVAESLAEQILKRVGYRRAMKKAVETCWQASVYGVRIRCSGRLGGREIASSDHYTVGNLPLQKLRAIIDYGFAEALTPAGHIGIKVWLYKGDIEEVADHSQ